MTILFGSDHYPIPINFYVNFIVKLGVTRWNLGKADCGKFASSCDEEFNKIVMSEQI